MFSQACVKNSVHMAGGRGVHPRADTPAPKKADGYCSRRYASYWNAFLFLLSATKLRQGNVFMPVCHSVHSGGGVCLSACWDTSPWADPLPAVTAAGGTHPAGMHFCFVFLVYVRVCERGTEVIIIKFIFIVEYKDHIYRHQNLFVCISPPPPPTRRPQN